MATNVINSALNSTVRIFDQFYDLDLIVNADQYDVVNAFFTGYTSSAAAARAFTQTLFRIANETQTNVLDLLQTFQQPGEQADKLKVSLTMAYYLNETSNKTVMFGVNPVIAPNQNIQRNIVQ